MQGVARVDEVRLGTAVLVGEEAGLDALDIFEPELFGARMNYGEHRRGDVDGDNAAAGRRGGEGHGPGTGAEVEQSRPGVQAGGVEVVRLGRGSPPGLSAVLARSLGRE